MSESRNAPDIDLEEVKRLIAALERDLDRLGGGSPDFQRLKDEVETLKNVLDSPIQRHHWVRDGLHGMRVAIEDSLDSALVEGIKGSRYVAEIGRILGL
jgi:hypothetical protein